MEVKIIDMDKIAGKEPTVDEVVEEANKRTWSNVSASHLTSYRDSLVTMMETWQLAETAGIQSGMDLHETNLIQREILTCRAIIKGVTVAIAMCEKYREDK